VYQVEFYCDRRGECQVGVFLEGLPPKVRAKAAKWIQVLQERGPDLKRPFADVLRDGIRELRLSFGRLEIRFLYFIEGRDIVVCRGFLKKTAVVPDAEIERAVTCRDDWRGGR
jgi:phage-related protein